MSVHRPEMDMARSSPGDLQAVCGVHICRYLVTCIDKFAEMAPQGWREGWSKMTDSRQPGRLVVPGVPRRRFLQAPGLGAAAAATAGLSGGTAAASTARRSAAAKPLPKGLTGTISDLKHVVILMQEN